MFYIAVKLAENDCSSCNAHQRNEFVSDTSSLQTEDVYEGISSPHCRSCPRNGLLKPQKFADVSTITGSNRCFVVFFLGNRRGYFMKIFIARIDLMLESMQC